MKNIIVSVIIGLLWGGLGSILFETSDGFLSMLLSDFSIGGIIVGVVGTDESVLWCSSRRYLTAYTHLD